MDAYAATKAAYIGGASLAALYGARWLRGSTEQLPLSTLALVTAVSAGTAYVAPNLCAYAMCPHSPGFPIAEAAVSSGLVFGAHSLVFDTNEAMTFVPVQFVGYLAGNYAYNWMQGWPSGQSAPDDSA